MHFRSLHLAVQLAYQHLQLPEDLALRVSHQEMAHLYPLTSTWHHLFRKYNICFQEVLLEWNRTYSPQYPKQVPVLNLVETSLLLFWRQQVQRPGVYSPQQRLWLEGLAKYWGEYLLFREANQSVKILVHPNLHRKSFDSVPWMPLVLAKWLPD